MENIRHIVITSNGKKSGLGRLNQQKPYPIFVYSAGRFQRFFSGLLDTWITNILIIFYDVRVLITYE